MGLGDDIMATAYARAAVEQARSEGSPQEDEITKVVFGNPETFHDPKTNRLNVHWSEVFAGNPYVLQQGEVAQGVMCMSDYPGHRLYIDYEKSHYEVDPKDTNKGTLTQFYFRRDFSAPTGELYFDPKEKEQALAFRTGIGGTGFILLEPRVKGHFSGSNKAWPEANWIKLVEALEGCPLPLVQPVNPTIGGIALREYGNVLTCVTKTFRQAAALVAASNLFVGTDGALHHTAAAVGTDAVVLWSGYSSPKQLGYREHTNLGHFDFNNPTGELKPSEFCKENMKKITVDEVREAIMSALADSGERMLVEADETVPEKKDTGDDREESGPTDS